MKTILIIEDDIRHHEGLKDNLEFEGYRVLTETNGTRGLKLAMEKSIGVVLFDIMLPGLNGDEICRKIKKEKPDLAVIMLTARGSEMDKVSGLDTGADDYITKPVKPKILVSKINALLRRTMMVEDEVITEDTGPIKLDRESYLVYLNSEKVSLPRKEVELLALLMTTPGKVYQRDEIGRAHV